jgi:hypothetical protein
MALEFKVRCVCARAWCSGGGETGREKRERERGRSVSDARVYCIWKAKAALQEVRAWGATHTRHRC